MQCATIKEGIECSFMGKAGCSFLGGACKPIVDKCQGCDRVKQYADAVFCKSFPDPGVKWRTGICNMATHVKVESKSADSKVRVGQQKQVKKKK
ncbi:MAG: PxxKW family cysteine-rich protein [Deltaproteobacteria bacterium]|nr:PxxKW family cysteine-rich protein [Deltaproteobacteria bacterium]